MDVLTSETCWALSKLIKKQVTSSWSIFIQESHIFGLTTCTLRIKKKPCSCMHYPEVPWNKTVYSSFIVGPSEPQHLTPPPIEDEGNRWSLRNCTFGGGDTKRYTVYEQRVKWVVWCLGGYSDSTLYPFTQYRVPTRDHVSRNFNNLTPVWVIRI